jgi:hypothetical protein
MAITLVVQLVIGTVAYGILLNKSQDAARVAAQSAAQSQARIICPLMKFFVDYYNQLDKAGKLSDPGKTARDQMQDYTNKIGCPRV